MNPIDWIVLFGTILSIAGYGVWQTRKSATMEGYLKGGNQQKWWMIGISIMATQASAVTFISTPGMAYDDGMRFLQFYLGLPVAMVLISMFIVPIYYKLKVYTAYEYLESRFDLKTRILAAILFLILRGLSSGITLFAPALVLSTLLSWPLEITTILIGSLVIVYVVSGGSQAVSLTQRQQMAVIMSGMIIAGIYAVVNLPDHVSASDAFTIAGELGKFNLINPEFNLKDRYNIWSGLIAGTFLFLAYFGTDQSQVARYLGGASLTESRLGLMFNGLLKIPMQFLILYIGVMVFVFYLFNQAPVFHNTVLLEKARQSGSNEVITNLENQATEIFQKRKAETDILVEGIHRNDPAVIQESRLNIKNLIAEERQTRDSVRHIIKSEFPTAKTDDRDYIFLHFVISNLPHGLIGLLLAVMFSAAMSSMAGELSSLSSTTTVDLYMRTLNKTAGPQHYLKATRWFTIGWAVLAMIFAMLASFSENLIQFVNIIGSLFYGTLLGIFLTAFILKKVRGTAVFIAAIIAELVIFYCFFFTNIAFLQYNFIGCFIVMALSLLLSLGQKESVS